MRSANVETLNQALSAMTADRDAAVTGEREAEHREAQLRSDLQSLRDELDLVKTRYDNTTAILETALLGGKQARADLESAMTVISERDSEVERLRLTIIQRDRESTSCDDSCCRPRRPASQTLEPSSDSPNEHRAT